MFLFVSLSFCRAVQSAREPLAVCYHQSLRARNSADLKMLRSSCQAQLSDDRPILVVIDLNHCAHGFLSCMLGNVVQSMLFLNTPVEGSTIPLYDMLLPNGTKVTIT